MIGHIIDQHPLARAGGIQCHIDRILAEHGKRRWHMTAITGRDSSHISRIATGVRIPSIAMAILILDGLEQLTGKRFEIRDVWTLSEKRRRPKPGNLGGYRHGVRSAA